MLYAAYSLNEFPPALLARSHAFIHSHLLLLFLHLQYRDWLFFALKLIRRHQINTPIFTGNFPDFVFLFVWFSARRFSIMMALTQTVSRCVCNAHVFLCRVTLICRWCCFLVFVPALVVDFYYSVHIQWHGYFCVDWHHMQVLYFRHTLGTHTHTSFGTLTHAGTQLHSLSHTQSAWWQWQSKKRRVFLYFFCKWNEALAPSARVLADFGSDLSLVSVSACVFSLLRWSCCLGRWMYTYANLVLFKKSYSVTRNCQESWCRLCFFVLMLFCLRFQANVCMYVCIKWNDEEQKILFMGQKHLHVPYTEYWTDRLRTAVSSLFSHLFAHNLFGFCWRSCWLLQFKFNTTEQLKTTYPIRKCRNNGRIIQIFGFCNSNDHNVCIADFVLNFSSVLEKPNMKIKLKPDQQQLIRFLLFIVHTESIIGGCIQKHAHRLMGNEEERNKNSSEKT